MDEVYQSLDDANADDSLVTEAADRRRDWLSQIDFTKYTHFCHNLSNRAVWTYSTFESIKCYMMLSYFYQ